MNNKKPEIRNFILEQLDSKLRRSGINELKNDLDLVKSGLLDSMSFVDLVVDIEKRFNVELDFDSAFQQAGFTTFYGLIETIERQIK